ncbi:MAG: hypothetical protein HYY23_15070 [Verrucomicrobia bacterium]|nr:hypothetical protein [Verrucomicrobiota bacterium]
MAELLKKELGVEASQVKGRIQELSIQVGNQVVARKKWFRFPEDQTVVAAVRKALSTV